MLVVVCKPTQARKQWDEAPLEKFRPHWKMYWTYFKAIGHTVV